MASFGIKKFLKICILIIAWVAGMGALVAINLRQSAVFSPEFRAALDLYILPVVLLLVAVMALFVFTDMFNSKKK